MSDSVRPTTPASRRSFIRHGAMAAVALPAVVSTLAFHCHILPHAESEHGMFGMVTALVVQPAAV